MTNQTNRRGAMKTMAMAAAAAAAGGTAAQAQGPATAAGGLKGNVRHAVSRWCYGKLSLEQLCDACKDIGIEGIDLVGPGEWATIQAKGLKVSLANGPSVDGLGGIGKAFNRLEHHDKLVPAYEAHFEKAAAAGVTNVICFSGNRDGLDDEKGAENCAAGLKRLIPAAEKHNVTLILELLNSKRNHKDYQCDHTAWGVKVCKLVGSDRLKLLYDIYHMQIMEGDIIDTIREFHPFIGHYHTGGVPGRNEIDDTQEIYYPAVLKAVVATGFKGFVAQEFVPKRDPLTSLRQAIHICDV